ncbi:MAG: glutamyl-tRNA(Gln) amidotransferase subunit D [Bacteroidetes bacterium RIFOXYA12_FULL_35_11]|nr:MAG: glutamyl-tRNA(Gln) amidotransferase subunit D [Bacteroidetes bacterium GWF2_35_48]OFY76030.1 MAG: glutamyl-tRNA(Gln) amidotransferase subunit D [Bacteroidetes bacterium RIFOXYA12_FULL_35_11]OFY93761.1 MAG: glutamyl-tRNA(Gln) amidotransferase subunit D [Bacteroidetes bacterium RIFOXYC12_FULL_35_7]OFY95955.1 MAG: glutamyl-tRNA(Gln) amidotransferase subunit D [Bacteroidetes bacterium RIFOXYB2_FULL_35_7]HBX51452.1 Glu-tRNA(Gln) amidotransferase GatDE subunit D [Bacteroidales bacterium]
MAEDFFQGYKGAGLKMLMKFNVRVWGQAEIETSRGKFAGTVLPRSENDDDQHIVIKIITGYNVGLDIKTITSMKEVGYKKANYKIPEKEFPYTPGLPKVKLIGTGGTIASRLDYRTGAVIPAFTPGELYGAVPELADICNLTTEKLFAVFSENMGPEQYKKLAIAIGKEIENGIEGIVIGHGTDTLHYTAAALTFMIQDSPVPIVLVGSQRSSDRPSSDAALNLIHANYTAAYSDIAEVMVCMFGPTSDEYGFLHRGTRVRKMHSSYRSTFRTIGDTPLATVSRKNGVTPIKQDYNHRRKDRKVKILPYFEEKVAMIYYYTNMQPDMIDSLVDNGYKGIIIIGTGLGHVNKPLYPAIERAVKKGVHIFMTVQTLWGYVHMFVYDTGRDLMAKGVIPAENMLPEVAYIKLGWVLGQTNDPEEVRRLMLTPINDEITTREPYNGYLIYQGGVPEVEDFIRKFHK